MSHDQKRSLSDNIIKYIDYGTEEYIKQLLSGMRPGINLQVIKPYVGIVEYPSNDFLTANLSYGKTVQFQSTTYVGHLEFLLPQLDAPLNTGCCYTLLSFTLDGKKRKFLQISGGNTMCEGQLFRNFVLNQFPDVNNDIAFNRNAFHVLSDIEITGAKFVSGVNGFEILGSGYGAFTPGIVFEIAVSGYKCILQ